VSKSERPPQGPLVSTQLMSRFVALVGRGVLGVLCLGNRPSHALDQLGRVVIAGQVLWLNVLVEQDV
jgi:hypothetical protein